MYFFVLKVKQMSLEWKQQHLTVNNEIIQFIGILYYSSTASHHKLWSHETVACCLK